MDAGAYMASELQQGFLMTAKSINICEENPLRRLFLSPNPKG